MQSFENCPGDHPMKFFVTVNTSAGFSNEASFAGYLEVTRVVNGPMELLVELNRCDIGMKNCDKLPSQKISRFCHKLNDKKAFYYGFLSTVQPSLECPFQPQRYEAAKSTVDLTAMSFLPLSGSIWIASFKLMSGEGKSIEMAYCGRAEIKIVRARSKKRKESSQQ